MSNFSSWKLYDVEKNSIETFKEMPRDQRADRERFNKLMGEFRSKTRVEENATGISPDPPSETEILLEEISEIMLNTVHNDKNKDDKDERAKALAVRDAAMHTWGKTKDTDGVGSSEEESDIDGSSEESMKLKSRKQRKRSGNPLENLRMKSEQNMLIQKQEIELRKEQAILEKQKLDAKEKQQQKKNEQLILQQQKMNQPLETQQKQFNLQQQQQQMQQMQMQMQAAMLSVL